MTKILFVLKFREQQYDSNSSSGDGYSCNWGDDKGSFLHSGLYNSAKFVCDMLEDHGRYTKLVHVIDNNRIHKEIVDYGKEEGGPVTHVIIEAFWVVPEKFIELTRVCPDVKFIIRNHSEVPFLANEGIAFDWSLRYTELPNVFISCNAPRMLRELRVLVQAKNPGWSTDEVADKVPYLPNYYPLPHYTPKHLKKNSEYVDIGCFGAIRPLKNHIVQAIAAIEFAERIGKKLRFHINAGRIEMNGSPILHNLRGIFSKYGDQHELVEHKWRPHAEFKKMLLDMDIVTQVSFSETFNIVAADAASQGIPLVTSKEVPWASKMFQADPTDSAQIARVMFRAYTAKHCFPSVNMNLNGLKKYDKISKEIWMHYFKRW
jgi:hypothetical protein